MIRPNKSIPKMDRDIDMSPQNTGTAKSILLTVPRVAQTRNNLNAHQQRRNPLTEVQPYMGILYSNEEEGTTFTCNKDEWIL